jgi:hypothetical protein
VDPIDSCKDFELEPAEPKTYRRMEPECVPQLREWAKLKILIREKERIGE